MGTTNQRHRQQQRWESPGKTGGLQCSQPSHCFLVTRYLIDIAVPYKHGLLFVLHIMCSWLLSLAVASTKLLDIELG